MTLSDLASLGSFVSGIAVLASLAFLFFQMRQMTDQAKQAERHQQAAIRQGRTATLVEMNLRLAETHADLFWPIARGERPAGDLVELRRFIGLLLARIQLYSEQFEQYAEGLLNERDFAGMRDALRNDMGSAGIRVAWSFFRLGSPGSDRFVAFVDRIVAETKPVASVFTAEIWNSLVAAELAKAHAGPAAGVPTAGGKP